MPRTVRSETANAHLSDLIAAGGRSHRADGVPVARIVPFEPPLGETIALMRQERARRPRVPAADIRTAKEQGRA